MSKCPGLYFDIGKKARDVLHKDYVEQPSLQFHYKFFDWNLDLSCKLQETVPGLRTLLECTVPDSGKVELQYMNNYTGISGCIGLLGNPDGEYYPVANLSGLIGTSILSLGGSVAFDISTRMMNKINAGLCLQGPYLAASLTVQDMFDTVKGSCYVDVNPLTNSSIAAEVNYSITTKETSVNFGAQHSLFPYTLVKARLDTYGRAGALFQLDLWQRFFVTIAGEMDFGSDDMVPKVGFSVALKP